MSGLFAAGNNPYGRRLDRASRPCWTDVMQVCEQGHQITDRLKEFPDRSREFCEKCGSKTISACPKCQKPIPGYRNVSGVLHLSSYREPVPMNCGGCGTAFPWKGQKADEMMPTMSPSTSNKVFVVHGHSEEMKQAAARVLQTLSLMPVILHEQPNKGMTIIEKIEEYADVGFAIVLLSGDDLGYLAPAEIKKPAPKRRARQNVILELGFFLGKLGRGKVVALVDQCDLEFPSDYSGIVYTAYDAPGHWKFELVRELRSAGYDIDANKLIA
jgi:predicted nucleotide-binding protein